MLKNKYLASLIYLPISLFFMLFFISIIFNSLGHLIHGGDDIINILKKNIFIYLKIGFVGFIVGFVLCIFKIR